MLILSCGGVRAGSPRLLVTSSGSTTTFWPRSRASSATPASATTASTPSSTLSPRQVTRKYSTHPGPVPINSQAQPPVVPPRDRSLRELDIELMRRLSPRVNVIPVIGKSDTLTPSELVAFKARVSHSRLGRSTGAPRRCTRGAEHSAQLGWGFAGDGGHRVLQHPGLQFPVRC